VIDGHWRERDEVTRVRYSQTLNETSFQPRLEGQVVRESLLVTSEGSELQTDGAEHRRHASRTRFSVGMAKACRAKSTITRLFVPLTIRTIDLSYHLEH